MSVNIKKGRPLLQPNAQHQYQVTREDLPLACPMPEMYLWNSHPRVYLAIEQTGWAKCSYCGAEYHLLGSGNDSLANDPLPDVQMS